MDDEVGMEVFEVKWTEKAIDLCDQATRKGVSLIFRTEVNDDHIIVTNVKDANLVAALNGNYEGGEADEE